MNDDIVEWLRDQAFRKSGPTIEAVHTKQQEWIWADEIERLRKENEELRESKKETERDLAYKHAIISICSGYSEGMDIAEKILATVDIKLTEDMIKRMRRGVIDD